MRRRILQEVAAQRMASFQSSLSCVSRAHPALRFGPNRPTTGITISIGSAHAIALAGLPKLYLRAFQGIRIDVERSTLLPAPWIGYVEEYSYRIGTSELGGKEIISYHSNKPSQMSSIASSPHLHIGSIISSPLEEEGFDHFHKRHIPTGIVPFSSVIRFLIEELGVEPIRSNWDEILANVLD